ncbi:MAG TPA: class I SAM-dependent methyltransferase [Thermomicrobiales bacterium]|nr:class I SAM-dependent methyltransferase [Thermomicrobiales bacterium]
MTAAAYDAIAEWYDEALRAGSLHDLILPALLRACGPVAGRRVCDLGCGSGVAARALARAGARVVGVDLSAALLAIARRYEAAEPLGVAYLRDDARALAAVADGAFDGVACNLALMDIDDLGATARAVRRVLRRGGWFACTITHPCFLTPHARSLREPDGAHRRLVWGYFAEGFWRSDNPDGVRGKVGARHRTLGTYLNTLLDAGLVLERFDEPAATGDLAARFPIYAEVAAVAVLRCRAR